MKTLKLAALAALLMGSSALTSAAQAQSQFGNIVVIGDSLSDPGNYPKYVQPTSVLVGNNFLQSPYYNYHFSNGPVYADLIGGLLHISGTTNNQAVGGAYTGQLNQTVYPGVTITGGNIGAAAFSSDPFSTLNNSSMQNQVQNILSSGVTYGSRDLAIVFGGANDAFATLGAIQQVDNYLLTNSMPVLTNAQTTTIATTTALNAATNIGTEITELHAIGVRNFVVPNLPNLGLTPEFNGNPLTSAAATAVGNGINTAISATVASLAKSLGVNITVIDTNALLADMTANPAKYGLTNVTSQCYGTPSAGLTNVAFTTCATPNTYLYWDTVHPTAYVQAIFAQYMASILDGPTVVAAQGQMVQIATQGSIDGIINRATALRLGASGFSISADGGADSVASDHPLSVYVTADASEGSRSTVSNALGFNYSSSRVAMGADLRVTPNFVVGMVGDFSQTAATLSQSMGSDRLNAQHIGLYATSWGDAWFATAGGLIGFDDYSQLNRNTFVADQVAHASTTGTTRALFAQGGPLFHVAGVTLGPVIGVQEVMSTIGGSTETGAVGINQTVGAQNIHSTIGSIGGQATYPITLAGFAVTPGVSASWHHEFAALNRTISTTNVSQSETTVLTTIGGNGADFVRVGASLDMKLTGMLSLRADVMTTDGSGRSDFGGQIHARLTF